MNTPARNPNNSSAPPPWVPLAHSFAFLCRYPRLLGWSLILVVLTGTLTWFGYLLSVDLINQFTGSFFITPPSVEHFWHWPLLWGWTALKWIYLVLSRVVAFYLAFVLAYSLTTPGYVFLSTWAGNRYCEQAGQGEATLTLSGTLVDLREGIKIGAMGLVVTVVALFANFIPVIGQARGLCSLCFLFNPDVCRLSRLPLSLDAGGETALAAATPPSSLPAGNLSGHDQHDPVAQCFFDGPVLPALPSTPPLISS